MSETASTPALEVEIATLERDVTATLLGYALTPRDSILAARGGWDALQVYQDLARDGHTGSVLRKRRAAVIARKWTVEPASEAPIDVRAAHLARAALARIRFDRLSQGLLTSVLTGLAVAEVIWEAAELRLEDGSRQTWIVPKAAKVRNPRRFVFGRDGALRLRTREAPSAGIDLPPRKFITCGFWAEENEDPYGRGLGHDLFWPVYFKRNGVALWNALIEKYGQPFVYAEYPQGTSDADKNHLLETIQSIARNAGLVVPAGTLLKVLETGRTATGDLHAAMTREMNAEISKIVLGETLTTEMGPNGSRAASQTHDDVRQELADSDADLLSGDLNDQLLRWITEVNLPGGEPPTVWRRAPEDPDLQGRATLDKTLFDMGFEPTDAYVAETYGPGYQRIRGRPPATVPPAAAPPDPAFAEAEQATAAELLADRLARDAAGAQAQILAAVRAQVQAAASFEDLEERLLRLASAMPIQALVDRLGPAFAVANLAGRSDVQDENAAP